MIKKFIARIRAWLQQVRCSTCGRGLHSDPLGNGAYCPQCEQTPCEICGEKSKPRNLNPAGEFRCASCEENRDR